MNITTLSATQARNKWFELLNTVYFKGHSVIIKKNNMPMIKLVPLKEPNLTSAKEIIEKTYGFLKNVPKTSWPKSQRAKQIAKFSQLESLWKQ